mgnify:CR=1 FL=1
MPSQWQAQLYEAACGLEGKKCSLIQEIPLEGRELGQTMLRAVERPDILKLWCTIADARIQLKRLYPQIQN